jgi:ADP-heptose:LPS heptosyltransferase
MQEEWDILNTPGWPELLERFHRTTFYLGNDSGISHLAGLLGLRGMVFFRITDPKIWRPLGKGLLSVRVK